MLPVIVLATKSPLASLETIAPPVLMFVALVEIETVAVSDPLPETETPPEPAVTAAT
jgi:hypothetical protein